MVKLQYMNYYSTFNKQMLLFYVPIYDTELFPSGLMKMYIYSNFKKKNGFQFCRLRKTTTNGMPYLILKCICILRKKLCVAKT